MKQTITTSKDEDKLFAAVLDVLKTKGNIKTLDKENHRLYSSYLSKNSLLIDLEIAISKDGANNILEINIPGRAFYDSGAKEIINILIPILQTKISTLPDKGPITSLNTNGETCKICPYCAEEIKVEAKKCKHCGEFLGDDKKINRQHDVVQNTGETIEIFAIICFLAGLIGLWILPVVFVPIGMVAAIISYFRLNSNKNLTGSAFRIIGALLVILNLLYIKGYLDFLWS